MYTQLYMHIISTESLCVIYLYLLYIHACPHFYLIINNLLLLAYNCIFSFTLLVALHLKLY